MDCKTCDIPDVNCYEQCKEHNCNGCFGASFNDCGECKYGGNEKMIELENIVKDENELDEVREKSSKNLTKFFVTQSTIT